MREMTQHKFKCGQRVVIRIRPIPWIGKTGTVKRLHQGYDHHQPQYAVDVDGMGKAYPFLEEELHALDAESEAAK
jgi:hypothetical protein